MATQVMRGLFCDKGRVVVRWSAVGDTGDERLYYRIKEKERKKHTDTIQKLPTNLPSNRHTPIKNIPTHSTSYRPISEATDTHP